jgi:2-polyprenyl-3-methyl-5-hydroxy-6-metoxy-1,4-benzoquinol methylase
MTKTAARRIAACFSRRFDRHYAASKLRSDPLYDEIGALLRESPLPLLDPGCGLGLLAFSLRGQGLQMPVRGLDFDGRKIAAARAAASVAGAAGVEFSHNDFTAGLPEHQGNVCLLDILQYVTPAQQAALLEAAARRVAPGGMLIIRSGLRDRSLRFRITLWVDRLAKATCWMKCGPAHFPEAGDFRRILAPFGEISISPLWGRTPFNNHLIVLRRPAPAA